MQHKAVYLLFCKFTLHVSGANHTHHQEYTKLTTASVAAMVFTLAFAFVYRSLDTQLISLNAAFLRHCM